MSGARPAAAAFAYAENGLTGGGGYEDLLQDVLYAAESDGRAAVAIEPANETRAAVEAGQEARVAAVTPDSTAVQTPARLGPARIIPWTTQEPFFAPNVRVVTNLSTQTLFMEGSCEVARTDVLTTPIVMYTGDFGFATAGDSFVLFENASLLYESPGANYSGFVNNETGVPEDWDTATWGAAPVVSQLAWFAYNCREAEWYVQPWYALLFHDFPRIVSEHFFVYPGSPTYAKYLVSLILTALPLVCIASIVLFFEPFVLFLKHIGRWVRSTRRRFKRHRRRRASQRKGQQQEAADIWSLFTSETGNTREQSDLRQRARAQPPEIELSNTIGSNARAEARHAGVLEGDASAALVDRFDSGPQDGLEGQYLDALDTESDASEPEKKTCCDRSGGCLCCLGQSRQRRRPRSLLSGEGFLSEEDEARQSPRARMQNIPRSVVSGHSSLGLNGLTSREKRKEALRLRQEILELVSRLDRTLTPSSLPKRALLIFLLLLALIEVPIGITLSLAFYDVMADFENGADSAQALFQMATDMGRVRQSIVQEFASSCGSQFTSAESALLATELDELARYLTLVTPSNVIPADLNFLGGLRFILLLVWQCLNAILCIMVISAIWSGVLTYCRFTWGEEKVVCQRPSFCLGRCLQPFVIVTSCFSWIAIGLFVIILSVLADACFRPSFLQVNSTEASYTSSANEQDSAQIYNFELEFSQDIPGLNVTKTSLTTFNVGAYLSNCYTTAMIFNPYSYTLQLANEAHLEMVRSLGARNATSLGCNATAYTTAGFYSYMANATQCEQLGGGFGASVSALCIDYGMLELFTFFVSLILFNMVALVVYSNSRELTPNLYRMHAGKDLQSRIQQLQSMLRDLLQDQAGSLSRQPMQAHTSMSSIGRSRTASSLTDHERGVVAQRDLDVA